LASLRRISTCPALSQSALNQELEARKISQADAAKVLGVTQPKVSGFCELTAYAPLALFIVALHTGIDPYVVNIFSKRR
jgi:predicted XRE-type DNA-binding protein